MSEHDGRVFLVRRYPHETFTVEFYKSGDSWFWEASGVINNVRDDESEGFDTIEAAKKDAARQCNEHEDCQGRWKAAA